MSAVLVCTECSATLSIRQGKPAKFCPKCGCPVNPNAIGVASLPIQLSQEQMAGRMVGQTVPPPILNQGSFPLTQPPSVTFGSVTPRPVAAVVPTDPLAVENEEVASWRWNWGAFLVPGVWLMAHRIKPKIVPLILLGVPIMGFLVMTIISMFSAITAESASGQGVVLSYFDTPSYTWGNSTIYTGWLLGLYAFACLMSIRTARHASLEAWRNFPNQRLTTFRKFQISWAIGGLLVCVGMVGGNIGAWEGWSRAQQSEDNQRQRQYALNSGAWVQTDPAGKKTTVWTFFEPDLSGKSTCLWGVRGSGVTVPATYRLVNNQVSVTSIDPIVGHHTYVLSEDKQTIVEVGGDGKTFYKASQ